MPSKVHSWKFVDDKRTPVYKTLAVELDAIARGKKPISYFASDQRTLGADLEEIQPLANDRSLRVTVHVRGKTRDVFVHPKGAEDRIAPLRAALSQSPWNFESEAKLGELLGYTPAQRKAWLAAETHARPAFGVITLYADIVHGYPFPLVWFREPGRVPAPDAYKIKNKQVPGLELWRAGMDPTYAKHLDARGVVDLAGASKKINATFDKAVRTDLEMLGPKGWHIPSRSKTRRR